MRAAVALTLLLTVVEAPSRAQSRPVALHELTLPADRLPEGCSMSARGPFGPGPWHGSDEPTLANIRKQFAARVPVPDGPPMSRGEAARYNVQLAAGIDEGYTAFYQDQSPNLIQVAALRFAAVSAADAWPAPSIRSAVQRLAYGPLVIVVSGGDGACRRAIADYLVTLGK